MATAIKVTIDDMYQIMEVMKGSACSTNVKVGRVEYRVTDREVIVRDAEDPDIVYWQTAYTNVTSFDYKKAVTLSFDYVNLITFYTL